MIEDKISSGESEGAFNEFIEDQLEEILDGILTEGGLEEIGGRGTDIIVEVDDITPPQFTFGDNEGGEGGGKGNQGPGEGAEKIRFKLPIKKLMDMVAERLKLPDLTKEGEGKIKEVSYEFKTFGTAGVILDKKRTFKRSLKTSIGMGQFDPETNELEVSFRRKDKRFKLPERVEKPKFKAAVFYMGDISYSTYGERLDLEKRIVSFIHHWLDHNYGADNVDHRFFVHDSKAHEVMPEDFYKVSNAGGTKASIVFDLVSQISYNEYDPESTNFYGFYFGDGELFSNDADDIKEIIANSMYTNFNRIGIVEVKPSSMSHLIEKLNERYAGDNKVRMSRLSANKEIIDVIKKLFGEVKNA